MPRYYPGAQFGIIFQSEKFVDLLLGDGTTFFLAGQSLAKAKSFFRPCKISILVFENLFKQREGLLID